MKRLLAAAAIVVALVVIALLVVPLIAPVELVWLGGVLVMATAVAATSGSAPAWRVVLLADLMLLMVVAGGMPVWPAPVVVALGVLWLVARRVPGLQPVASWAVPGRLTGSVLLLMGGTVVLSSAALVVWAAAARPEVSPYLQWTIRQPPLVVVGALIVFATLNAIGEEILFRGIFLSELRAVTSATVAVLATSVAFGIAHARGFPSGWTGMLMAGGYAIALGVIRVRSRGMLAPILTHAAADATIGLIAVLVLA